MLMNLVPLVPPRKLHGLRPEMGLSETRVPQTHLVYHRFPFLAILGYTKKWLASPAISHMVCWIPHRSRIPWKSPINPHRLIDMMGEADRRSLHGIFLKGLVPGKTHGKVGIPKSVRMVEKNIENHGFSIMKIWGKMSDSDPQVRYLCVFRKEVGGKPWCLNGF